MKAFKTFDGVEHPVSDAWFALVSAFPQLAGYTLGHVKDDTQSLLEISNFRLLTKPERAYIGALDAVRNLNATHKALAGRDVHALYGEQVPLDVVKFTDWTPDTCECTHQFLWRRDQDESRAHHPHKIIAACDRHAHHTTPEAHHAAIHAENTAKNLAAAAKG